MSIEKVKQLNINHAQIGRPFGSLHCVHAGPVGAPCVVLLHGFPEFWYGWRSQIPALVKAGFHVLAPDQRGYNLSSKPKGAASYSLDLLAEDVLAVGSHFGCEEFYLVGHDWGAAVAWHTAAVYPAYVQKLVILNVPHPRVMRETMRSRFSQLQKSWYILFFQLPWLPEFLLRYKQHQNTVRMLQASRSPGRFSESEITAYQEAWSQPGAWTAMVNWYRAALRHPPRREAAGLIEVPTLVIWGKKDVALNHEMAPASIERCEDGELVFLDHATHWVQHDEPERVNQLILDYLMPGA